MIIKDLEEFKLSEIDPSNKTWRELFQAYNDNFNKLYNLLGSLYNKFLVEKFSNLNSNVVTLSNSYITNSNSLLVFKNGALQLRGESYEETSRNSITFKDDIVSSDEIVVIILDIISSLGTPGDSAYQVALNNGFQGSQEEWLSSLVGEVVCSIDDEGNLIVNGNNTGFKGGLAEFQEKTAEGTSINIPNSWIDGGIRLNYIEGDTVAGNPIINKSTIKHSSYYDSSKDLYYLKIFVYDNCDRDSYDYNNGTMHARSSRIYIGKYPFYKGCKITREDNFTHVRRDWGYIKSYNGEDIPGDYISSTGDLSIGAEVIYDLQYDENTRDEDRLFDEKLTMTELIKLYYLHTGCDTFSNIIIDSKVGKLGITYATNEVTAKYMYEVNKCDSVVLLNTYSVVDTEYFGCSYEMWKKYNKILDRSLFLFNDYDGVMEEEDPSNVWDSVNLVFSDPDKNLSSSNIQNAVLEVNRKINSTINNFLDISGMRQVTSITNPSGSIESSKLPYLYVRDSEGNYINTYLIDDIISNPTKVYYKIDSETSKMVSSAITNSLLKDIILLRILDGDSASTIIESGALYYDSKNQNIISASGFKDKDKLSSNWTKIYDYNKSSGRSISADNYFPSLAKELKVVVNIDNKLSSTDIIIPDDPSIDESTIYTKCAGVNCSVFDDILFSLELCPVREYVRISSIYKSSDTSINLASDDNVTEVRIQIYCKY